MTLAILRKQWLDMQGRVWTYPIFAFTVSVLSGSEARVTGFHAFAALLLALDLASQTAGDDARHGTHEFMFTRPIDRRGYIGAKFFFGLPILLAFIGVCTLFELVNVREWFMTLITDPVGIDLAARPIDLVERAFGASVIVLAFAMMFLSISTTERGDSFVAHGVLSTIVVGIYLGFAMPFLRSVFGGAPSLAEDLRTPAFAVASFAVALVPAGALYWLAREIYARRALPVPGSGGGRDRNLAWVGALLVVIVVVGVLMYLFVGAPAQMGGE